MLATLDSECTVVESFGPIYRGRAWVAQWIAQWLAEDGRVLWWEIHDLQSLAEREVAQWTFQYTWRGEEQRFDGATITQLREGKIFYLREYATTASLFDWHGEWQ
ncbi:MAG: nuclear transport factor 2 family protein [Comamonadaceae bacterium]|nr:MAG: nuclear transport factor 2 family protein [Comamonadaceae bacterium]